MRAALALLLLGALPALAQAPPPLPPRPPPPLLDIDFEGRDLAAGLAEVASWAYTTVLVDPEVQEQLTVSLREIPWREAVDVMARMCRCDVQELAPGVLWVDRPARVTVEFADADVVGVLRLIASYAGAELVLTPGVAGRVSVDLKDEPWRRAMETVAGAAGLWVEERSGLVVVHPGPAPIADPTADPSSKTRGAPPLVSLALEGPLANALELVGEAAGRVVLVDPGVNETVSVYLRQVPWRLAVDLVARLTRCQVEERYGPDQATVLVLTRPCRTRFRAVGAPAAAWFQLVGREAGLNVVSAGVRGTIDCDLTGLAPDEVLAVTARAAGLEPVRVGDTVTLRAGPVDERSLQAPPDELDPLLEEIDRLAREGEADRLAPRLQELLARARARDRRPPASPSAEVRRVPAPSAEALAELDRLFRRVRTLAEQRQIEELVLTFADLRGLVGEHGLGLARVAPARLEREPPFEGEVQVGLLLQLQVVHGNLLLQAMKDALRREEPAALRPLLQEVDELVERMRTGEHESFHRNAMALELRAVAHRDRARRLSDMLALPLALTATVVPAGKGSPPRAILNGWIVAAGDEVKDEDGGVLPVRVVEVSPGAVRVRCEDNELVRSLPPR